MRTSLKKLRGFALQRHGETRDRRDRRLQQSMAQLDELARSSQDMQDMRDCYDSLLSAAAATANSAYEFSESLREMGACLLEKTALNDDEESGKVLLMLGKVQFELQKLVDNYRSHIFQTITRPSESLLNELRIVEEMKTQCDEKRSLYEYMITRHREKGRLKSSKGESFSSQQLQAAHDEYDEEATLFVFRLKSLKRGQSRSLLTQAARHHAAQLCFFRKALKSLETVEPHVKLVTEQQHIDYQFSGLEDNYGDDGDNDDSDDDDSDDNNNDDDGSYNGHEDSELSFDYGHNDQGQNVVSTPSDSMELDCVDLTFPQIATVDAAKLDCVDLTFPQIATVDAAKEKPNRGPGGDSFAFSQELKTISQSAPLTEEKKFDPSERLRQIQPLYSRKFHSYVLPTPVEPKIPVSRGPDTQVSRTKRTSLTGGALSYWHSSPLEQKKYDHILGNKKLSGPIAASQPSLLREGNNAATSTRFPPPLAEELLSQQHDRHTTNSKKIKRQAFSGPLMDKSWTNKPALSVSGPIVSTGSPKLFSGPLLQSPIPQPSSSPKLSPSASPTFVSSPKISELHELPRPPANLASKCAGRPSNQISYSVPLVSKGQEVPAANKLLSSAASPLPTPPLTVPRSFSIPSRRQRVTISPLSTPLGAPRTLTIAEDIASPRLTPISLSDIQPASTAS